jgi:hypothetical protein
VPIRALRVRRTRDAVRISDGQREYRLVSDVLCVGNLRLVGERRMRDLAKFVSSGSKTSRAILNGEAIEHPEVRVGGLTVTRRTIVAQSGGRLASFSGLRDRALFEAAQELRRELDLPRRAFVSQGGKPFLLDFECLFSLEGFTKGLRKRPASVVFTPMDPDLDQLWLNLDDGAYTSELRFVAMADGPRFVGAGDPALHLY